MTMGKRGSTNSEIRRDLFCTNCGAAWHYDGVMIRAKCPFCGKEKDARIKKQRVDKLKYIQPTQEDKNRSHKKQRLLLRKRIFFKICGNTDYKCSRCGCNDFRLLEINHKNGGGSIERKTSTREEFLRSIIDGKRPADDLELLCRPCNAIHYLEMKYGKLPIRVVWEGNL